MRGRLFGGGRRNDVRAQAGWSGEKRASSHVVAIYCVVFRALLL